MANSLNIKGKSKGINAYQFDINTKSTGINAPT